MTVAEINDLPVEQIREELVKCCGSSQWVEKMIERRPFSNMEELYSHAELIWHKECREKDWLEAFTHHPKIGDLKRLEKKFANTQNWASNEQAGVNTAKQKILEELADLNQQYETKFAYIFIVCATGKSAEEMLVILKERINNGHKEEIRIAMAEQNKITKIRLEKLIDNE
jgi:2-oxo-4-hydroxy-4-carboxy-5-ureidoimidazoline decarboxylase